MSRMQVCLALAAVLHAALALPRRGASLQVGDGQEVGGLTVQDPPAGWPLSDLRAYEQRNQHWLLEQDQQHEGTPPGAVWYASSPRQGRVLDSSAQDDMVYVGGAVESRAASETRPSQWQPSSSRYKNRKRNKPKQQQEQQQQQGAPEPPAQQEEPKQPEADEYHPQHHEQNVQERGEARKNKKTKKVSKRKPAPAAPPHAQLQTAAESPGTAVNVGYSIGFAADAPATPSEAYHHHPSEGGAGEGSASTPGATAPGRDAVEVVHGEGAVSYSSNTLLGGQHLAHQQLAHQQLAHQQLLHQQLAHQQLAHHHLAHQQLAHQQLAHQQLAHQQLPPQAVVSSNAIDGRPIYVAPLPQFESLPSPHAFTGDGSYQLGTVVGAGTDHVLHAGAPSPAFHQQPQHQHYVQTSAGPGKKKKIKAATAVLHINDGTDFKWQDLGNGVEVSAAITPNGLRGGYRDSIPIMEDNEEDDPPQLVTASKPLPLPQVSTYQQFDHGYALGNSAAFDQSNAVSTGSHQEGFAGKPLLQELASNHLIHDEAQRPADPFKKVKSNSYVDFTRGFSDSARQPHSLRFGKFGSDPLPLYYLPSEKPGGKPIPAVIMPLAQLRELQASISSNHKPTLDFPPPADPDQEHPFKVSTFSEFRPSHAKQHYSFSRPAFQRDPGFKAASSFRTPHQAHLHVPRGAGGPGVKVTKSVPVFEEHSVGFGRPSPSSWPPKESVDVQHFYMSQEEFDALRTNSVAPHAHSVRGHHGPGKRPAAPPPPTGSSSTGPLRAHGAVPLEPGAFAVTSSYRVRPAGG